MDIMLIQQGDVLFTQVDMMPKNIKMKPPHNGKITFAEGEATGHHHSCLADGVTLFTDSAGTLWCLVEKEATVTHQEHRPVTLPPGNYRVGIVREVDPFTKAINKVMD